MKVALFVEDAAQESFLGALVHRVALTESIEVTVDTRSAVGGRGAVLASFRRYVRDLSTGLEEFAEILVVGLDGNCRGRNAVVKEVREISERETFPGRVVPAVADPHIELWYLGDGSAVSRVIGAAGPQPDLPEYKCERARYKTLLREAFHAGDIDPPAGGSEYGPEIANALDLNTAARRLSDLEAFLSDLRSALREAAVTAG
jgi:hypothetical protein